MILFSVEFVNCNFFGAGNQQFIYYNPLTSDELRRISSDSNQLESETDSHTEKLSKKFC